MEELCKLDSSLRTLLLSEDRFLFCDETTEQVKVVNRSIGKMEYRKKYIWGIRIPILRLPISFMTTVAVVVKWPNASLMALRAVLPQTAIMFINFLSARTPP